MSNTVAILILCGLLMVSSAVHRWDIQRLTRRQERTEARSEETRQALIGLLSLMGYHVEFMDEYEVTEPRGENGKETQAQERETDR